MAEDLESFFAADSVLKHCVFFCLPCSIQTYREFEQNNCSCSVRRNQGVFFDGPYQPRIPFALLVAPFAWRSAPCASADQRTGALLGAASIQPDRYRHRQMTRLRCLLPLPVLQGITRDCEGLQGTNAAGLPFKSPMRYRAAKKASISKPLRRFELAALTPFF